MKPPTDAVFWKACFPARHVKNALPKIWKAAAHNEGLRFDPRKNPHRDSFFRKLAKCRSDQAAVNLMESYFRPKLLAKIKTKLKSVLKCILYRSLFLAGRKEKNHSEKS